MPKEVLGRAHSRLQTLLAGCGCFTTACKALCRVELACVWQLSCLHTLHLSAGPGRFVRSLLPCRAGKLRPCLYVSLVLAEADYGRLPWCSAYAAQPGSSALRTERAGMGRRSWL